MKNNSLETTIYLVRHGETEWNVKEILQGHKNSRLTEKGITQAQQLASTLSDIHFDAIFSSDLMRARKTAAILARERTIKIRISKFLRERTFGIYDGYSVVDYRNETREAAQMMEHMNEQERWMFKFHDTMESELDAVKRFSAKLRSIAIRHPSQTVLVVTHGGCIRLFLTYIGFGSRKSLSFGAVGNTAYVKLQSDGTTFHVSTTTGVTLQEDK